VGKRSSGEAACLGRIESGDRKGKERKDKMRPQQGEKEVSNVEELKLEKSKEKESESEEKENCKEKESK